MKNNKNSNRHPMVLEMPRHMFEQLSQTMKSETNPQTEVRLGWVVAIIFSVMVLILLFIVPVVLRSNFLPLFLLMLFFIFIVGGAYYFLKHIEDVPGFVYISNDEVGKVEAENSKKTSLLKWEDVGTSQLFGGFYDVTYDPGGRYSSPRIQHFNKEGLLRKMSFHIDSLVKRFSAAKNRWELRRLFLAHLALSASEPLILHRDILIMAQIDPVTWEYTCYPKYFYLLKTLIIPMILVLLASWLAIDLPLTGKGYIMLVATFIIFLTASIMWVNQLFVYLYPVFSNKTFQYRKPQLN